MKKYFFTLVMSISLVATAQPPYPVSVQYNLANTFSNYVTAAGAGVGTSAGSTQNTATTAQWHFQGGNLTIPTSTDWAYSIVETDKKEYIVCGYTNNYPTGSGSLAICPTIFKLDHLGKLVWTKTVVYEHGSSTFRTGVLLQVIKASDGYVATGYFYGTTGIAYDQQMVVEFDDDGNFLNNTPTAFHPDGWQSNTTSRAYSVALDPNYNSIDNIVVAGKGIKNSTSYVSAVITRLNKNTGTGNMEVQNSIYGGNSTGENVFNKIITRGSGSSYEIYACGSISAGSDDNTTTTSYSNTDGWYIPISIYHQDIWIAKTNGTLSSLSSVTYNKSHLNSIVYTDVGPLTARNMDGSGRIIYNDPISGYYYSDATIPLNSTNNKHCGAWDIIFANDGSLAVSAFVNYVGVGWYGNRWIIKDTWDVFGDYDEYSDVDGYLLKLNPSTLAMTGFGNKNIGHFSGKDFRTKVIQNKYDEFIISGSSADVYGSGDPNLPDRFDDYGTNIFIVCAGDDAGSDVWRRSLVAWPKEDMTCVFGLAKTADDGYVICGDNYECGDDWSVTKFAPTFQEKLASLGTYEKFGLGYIPDIYVLPSSQTWSSLKLIGSKVVVPSGVTLTIQNTSVLFAASDQLWDYYMFNNNASENGTYDRSDHKVTPMANGMMVGIEVQPGGNLIIDGSTLGSVNNLSLGDRNMWDGIVLLGDASHTGLGYQGRVTMTNNSTIEDARYGIYVASNWRTYQQQHPTVTGGLGSESFLTYTISSRYNGYANAGGGRVLADNTTFKNCRNGVNFQNAPIGLYQSAFESCTFESDANGMGDICFYTDENGDAIPANTHFAAWNVKNLRVSDCDFTCNTIFDEDKRPIGLISHTCGFRISDWYHISTFTDVPGNRFTNLSNGVIVENPPGISPMVTIRGNEFDNNTFGANVQGAHYGLVVKENVFKVPEILFPSTYYEHVGLTLAGCTGYDVSYNDFQSVSALNYWHSTGAVINNGHVGDELFKNNNFIDNLMFGSVALGTNGSDASGTGLQFKCNDYTHQYGIVRSSNIVGSAPPYPCVIRPHQGDCGTGTSPAGNAFNYCTGGIAPGGGKIISFDYDIAQVVTYNNNYAGSVFDPGSCAQYIHPLTSATILVNVDCPSGGGGVPLVEDACPTPYPYGDWGDPGMTTAMAALTTLDDDIANNNDPDVAVVLETQRNEVLGYMARFYSDSASYDTAAALLAGYGKYADALPFYLMAGDYQNAATMLSYLPVQTDDEQLYKYEMGLAIDLYSQGLTWMDIDTATRDTLMGMVQYDSRAGYMAGAVSALTGRGPVTWPLPLIDSAILDTILADSSTWFQRPGRGDYSFPFTKIDKAGDGFMAYPNPTNGTLNIVAPSDGRFTLYTLLGQKLQEYTISTGETELLLPRGIPAGIYIGSYRSDKGGLFKELKIMYQP